MLLKIVPVALLNNAKLIKGDTEMCLRCHEKKYVVNREGYYNTLREIIKFEFNLKPITMKQQHPTDGTPITENKEPVTTVSETVAEAEDSVSETVAEAEDSVSPMEKGAPVDVESASNEVTPDSNEQEPSSNAPAPNLNEPEGESFPTGN